MSNNELAPSMNLCSQCGTYHPPLQPGQICPMVKDKSEVGENAIDFSQFIINLKTILISQFEKKDIKDKNKLLKGVTINIVQFIENYTESK